MLTLESKFSDYVEALRKAGACEEVVAIHDGILKKNPELTIDDVYKTFVKNPDLDEGWPTWALKLIGKEMDVAFRISIITDLIHTPIIAYKLLQVCTDFTEEEQLILQDKYKGISSEIVKIEECLAAIEKSREFNIARVESLATAKSVTEAKALIEAKIGVATTISADSAVHTTDGIKKILEAERTKYTLETEQVVLDNGYTSVADFISWYEGLA
jgi:hypothetical protein